MYDHRYTPTFKDCVDRYTNRPEILAALSRTLTELAIKPFGNPRLKTHAVKWAPDTFTSYVTLTPSIGGRRDCGWRSTIRRFGHLERQSGISPPGHGPSPRNPVVSDA